MEEETCYYCSHYYKVMCNSYGVDKDGQIKKRCWFYPAHHSPPGGVFTSPTYTCIFFEKSNEQRTIYKIDPEEKFEKVKNRFELLDLR